MFLESSSISQLEPYLHNRGILWVGERLRKSNLTEEENHPVILPKKCSVFNMNFQWSPHKIAHGARGMTLNYLRQGGIWIVNARAVVWCLLHKLCYRSQITWKNGITKDGWSTKGGMHSRSSIHILWCRYIQSTDGALFNCFSSHIVHIEVTNSLDANFFILALHRFMGRRGAVCSI